MNTILETFMLHVHTYTCNVSFSGAFPSSVTWTQLFNAALFCFEWFIRYLWHVIACWQHWPQAQFRFCGERSYRYKCGVGERRFSIPGKAKRAQARARYLSVNRVCVCVFTHVVSAASSSSCVIIIIFVVASIGACFCCRPRYVHMHVHT